jgi:hypothetical protein
VCKVVCLLGCVSDALESELKRNRCLVAACKDEVG